MTEQSPVETLREIRANFEALQAELDAARARIAELEAARRWVPVGERLPEKRGEYLVRSHYRDDTFIAICEYDPDLIGSGWRTVSWVTHWQPLPAAPEAPDA